MVVSHWMPLLSSPDPHAGVVEGLRPSVHLAVVKVTQHTFKGEVGHLFQRLAVSGVPLKQKWRCAEWRQFAATRPASHLRVAEVVEQDLVIE
jgi:hypothetical protein